MSHPIVSTGAFCSDLIILILSSCSLQLIGSHLSLFAGSILGSVFTSSILIFIGSFLTFVFFIFFGTTISSSAYDSIGSFLIVEKYADVACSLLLFISFSRAELLASLSTFKLFKAVAILLEILL